jgi:hypothetical protein
MRSTLARGLASAVLITAVLAYPLSGLLAQSGTIVPDQIQEDWQLVIGSPDVVGVGPQITTSMSPVSDDSTPFVAFDLNYREYPTFVPGGMQLQVWSGDQVLSTSSQGTNQFTTSGETITWTQKMSLSNGTLRYHVMNGQSTTWGTFGGSGQLRVSFPAAVSSLTGYTPAASVANSGASWESNLVTQLTLVQVRYYSSGQLVYMDTTQRSIVAPPTCD